MFYITLAHEECQLRHRSERPVHEVVELIQPDMSAEKLECAVGLSEGKELTDKG
jgi:hypothetical protein